MRQRIMNELERKWWLVDAQGQVLGRLASQVAHILRGKHKPSFIPYGDEGDFVVVINAGRIRLTGAKLDKKVYYHHSGYPGGLKSVPAKDLFARNPEKMIKTAVQGMLPKNKLAARVLRKLKVYPGLENPHKGQQLEPIRIRG
jgi:large subunit ribosomal protein L13